MGAPSSSNGVRGAGGGCGGSGTSHGADSSKHDGRCYSGTLGAIVPANNTVIGPAAPLVSFVPVPIEAQPELEPEIEPKDPLWVVMQLCEL